MKRYSMSSHKRRNHQRWLNHLCHEVNRCVANDTLWLGRFVVEQVATNMMWFEDNSGGIMYCALRFRDKKTGNIKMWYTDNLDADWNIWIKMNNFIVEDCKVWENEKPYEEWSDYRNVP